MRGSRCRSIHRLDGAADEAVVAEVVVMEIAHHRERQAREGVVVGMQGHVRPGDREPLLFDAAVAEAGGGGSEEDGAEEPRSAREFHGPSFASPEEGSMKPRCVLCETMARFREITRPHRWIEPRASRGARRRDQRPCPDPGIP